MKNKMECLGDEVVVGIRMFYATYDDRALLALASPNVVVIAFGTVEVVVADEFVHHHVIRMDQFRSDHG